jgi:4-amino-4-deoxy-L-arabinose transferase-like glycosyltransferase
MSPVIDEPQTPTAAVPNRSRWGWSALARQMWVRLRTDRTAAVAVAIAVILNVVALSGWLWSRGGQTTDIGFGIEGSNAAVAVDGRIQAFSPFEDPPAAGAIMLMLADTGDVPGMPGPRGIDRIRVVSPDGTVLFEDGFDRLDPAWEVVEGTPDVSDGVLGAEGRLVLRREGDWSDVRVDARVRNVREMAIGVRMGEDDRGIVTRIRPTWWNQDESKTLSIRRGAIDVAGPGVAVELSKTETTKALVASLLRPYPYLLAAAVVLLAATAALSFARTEGAREQLAALGAMPPWFWPGVTAIFALVVTLALAIDGRSGMPFVPDSIAYLFQAKILASGHLSADPPPVPAAFQFFDPSPIVITGDHWAAQYPFGHPAVLAIGEVFGVPWLPPPLLAAASVFMLAIVGGRLYNARIALMAAVLLATSPFFIMQATNLMSHNTALFFLVGALLCMTLAERRPIAFGLAAGLLFGLFMNTRPLTAAALAAPFGLYLLWRLVPREDRPTWAMHVAAFVAGGLVMLGGYALYNYGTTGDAFSTGYQQTGVSFFEPSGGGAATGGDSGGIGGAIGVGGDHQLAQGLQNERVQMALLTLMLHGWPVWVGLAFVLLPFLLGTRRLADWWLLSCALAVMAVWVLYEGDGVMWGPRYWYEAIPFLMLLAARGADRAADLLAHSVAAVRDRDVDGAHAPLWAGRALVFSCVGVLVAYSLWAWLLGAHPTWTADFVPTKAADMSTYFQIDDRIPRMVEEHDVHNALVLVQPCRGFNCFGSVFWRNAPGLDGDIVYASDDPEHRDAVIEAFPGRSVYVADYNARTLLPYVAAESTPGTP